eukprot:COSAG01_NODE_67412_length_267_cov_0.613095_1_plen_50_part_10
MLLGLNLANYSCTKFSACTVKSHRCCTALLDSVPRRTVNVDSCTGGWVPD